MPVSVKGPPPSHCVGDATGWLRQPLLVCSSAFPEALRLQREAACHPCWHCSIIRSGPKRAGQAGVVASNVVWL